jgi:hypothetical protein
MANRFRDRIKSAIKPKYWRPKEGDYLTGTVVNVRVITAEYGDCKVAHIKDDDTKEVLAVLCGTVIANEFEKQGIKIGDRVGIKYLGDEKEYKDFYIEKDTEQETSPQQEGSD